MSNQLSEAVEPVAGDREHLADVEDGCGCVEVWETLSEHRGESADGA